MNEKYDLIITNHARERWVERIVDPTRYEHLSKCHETECETCRSLVHDIHGALRIARRQIDGRILHCYLAAKEADNRVKDLSFKEAIAKRQAEFYGKNLEWVDFWISGRAVLMVSKTPQEETPTLITVLTNDMIDGTVIKDTPLPDLKKTFKRWKHQARQKGA